MQLARRAMALAKVHTVITDNGIQFTTPGVT